MPRTRRATASRRRSTLLRCAAARLARAAKFTVCNFGMAAAAKASQSARLPSIPSDKASRASSRPEILAVRSSHADSLTRAAFSAEPAHCIENGAFAGPEPGKQPVPASLDLLRFASAGARRISRRVNRSKTKSDALPSLARQPRQPRGPVGKPSGFWCSSRKRRKREPDTILLTTVGVRHTIFSREKGHGIYRAHDHVR